MNKIKKAFHNNKVNGKIIINQYTYVGTNQLFYNQSISHNYFADYLPHNTIRLVALLNKFL